jgi:phenylalanyl-tRNA synthetase beta chain
MVLIYAKLSTLNKYIKKSLTTDVIKDVLMDIGMDVKAVSDAKDPELKIEITAEKADMVSAVGVARAIKYYLGFTHNVPKYVIAQPQHKVQVKNTLDGVYPSKTVCAILRNVPLNAELLQEMIDIQEKITHSFGRDRTKAGVGIYPTDKIVFPITFGGEDPEKIVFKPLEFTQEINGAQVLELHPTGKKYAHLLEGRSKFAVFRDHENNVLAMPPIINSDETAKVGVHHKDLFVEVTGENMHLLDLILKVLVTTFIEMGSTCEAVKVEYETGEIYQLSLDTWHDTISLEFVNKLIGFSISEAECMELLGKMMYGVEKVENGLIHVEIPCFRSDIWHDVDIADDIARAYGYNKIVPRFPTVSTVGGHLPSSSFFQRVSESLVSFGFIELYTYILTSSEFQFEKMGRETKHVRLHQSCDQGTNMCRTLILPEVLRALNVNRKNKYPQKVFENGFTIQVDEDTETGARNEKHLSVSIADPRANYTQIKAVLDELMLQLNITFEVKEVSMSFLIQGRSASIRVNGKDVGFIGEVHPQVLTNFGLLVPVASFEINLEKVF